MVEHTLPIENCPRTLTEHNIRIEQEQGIPEHTLPTKIDPGHGQPPYPYLACLP